MATTKIWDVRAHIGKLIAYVTNRDKTTMAAEIGGDSKEMRLVAEMLGLPPKHFATEERKFVTATYRNKNGNPTCDRSSIGRLDEASGKLIPNRNYYEIYLKQPAPPAGDIFSCGVYRVSDQICGELGITKLLDRYFPEHVAEMLTAAQYMLSEGNVMYYIDHYTETHQTACGGVLSDKQCSKMFSELREEDMMLFFREWMKHRKKDEYVAYDVTSISSY